MRDPVTNSQRQRKRHRPNVVIVRHFAPDPERAAETLARLLASRPRRQEEEPHGRSDSE